MRISRLGGSSSFEAECKVVLCGDFPGGQTIVLAPTWSGKIVIGFFSFPLERVQWTSGGAVLLLILGRCSCTTAGGTSEMLRAQLRATVCRRGPVLQRFRWTSSGSKQQSSALPVTIAASGPSGGGGPDWRRRAENALESGAGLRVVARGARLISVPCFVNKNEPTKWPLGRSAADNRHSPIGRRNKIGALEARRATCSL